MHPDLDLKQLVAGAGDAIVVADAKGAITLWNRAAERIFGFTEAEALGQSLDLIIPERQRQRHWEGYRQDDGDGVHQVRHRRAACAGAAQGRAHHLDRLHGFDAVHARAEGERHRSVRARRDQALRRRARAAQASGSTRGQEQG